MLTLQTQADMAYVGTDGYDFGYMISEHVGLQMSSVKLDAGIGYFHTDSYDARIYTYERGPLYTFTFPTLYGHGLRYSLMLRSDISSAFMMTAKCGVTNYFDRSVISSGLQEVNGSSLTDLDLQFRWKF